MTFPDFIRQLGIIPPDSFHLGKWQRVATETHPKKKNGAVKLSEDGRTGFAIDFSAHTETQIWRSGEEQAEVDRSKANAELSARLAARRAEEAKGMARARKAYAEAVPLRGAKE